MTSQRLRELQQEYLPDSLVPSKANHTVGYKVLNTFLLAVTNELLSEAKEETSLRCFRKFVPSSIKFGDIVLIGGLGHYGVYIGERLEACMFILLTSSDSVPSIKTDSRFLDSYFSYGLTSLDKESLNDKAKFMGMYDNDDHLVDVAKQVLNFYNTTF